MADESTPEQESDEDLEPVRIGIFFTAVMTDELEDIVDALAELADASGLFYEWATINSMDPTQVVPGSSLHQLLVGGETESSE